MIKRIPSDAVPEEVKNELLKLKKEIKDYVLIGDSFYEIKPFSVIKIVNFLNEITSIINEIKNIKSEEKDYEELTGNEVIQEQKSISLYDILSNEDIKDKFINLLMKLFDGIDKIDFEMMNIAQFNELLNKIWKVNINSFPTEEAKNEFITKVVSLLLLINPNLYRFSMAQKFMDDLQLILARNPELSQKINEELQKLYSEKQREQTKNNKEV